MEDEFKTPKQSGEFDLPENPDSDDYIEQFEQGGATQTPEPEDPIEAEPTINAESYTGQKIDVVRPVKPLEAVQPDFVENADATKVEPIKLDENIPPFPGDEAKKPAKKGFAKKLLTIFAVIILMAGSAAVAYWWRDKQANEFEKSQAESTQALQQKFDTITANLGDTDSNTVNNGSITLCDDTVECLPVAPAQSVLDNIKGVITTANTQPLEGYMATDATTITATANGVSSSSSNGTISTITDFLEKSSRVWDFNLSDLEVDSYKAGDYGTYFEDATIIGKSEDGEVIAITFDCNSKIHETLLVTDENIVH